MLRILLAFSALIFISCDFSKPPQQQRNVSSIFKNKRPAGSSSGGGCNKLNKDEKDEFIKSRIALCEDEKSFLRQRKNCPVLYASCHHIIRKSIEHCKEAWNGCTGDSQRMNFGSCIGFEYEKILNTNDCSPGVLPPEEDELGGSAQ